MVATIYVEADDFCKEYEAKLSNQIEKIPYLRKLYRNRKMSKGLTMGEIMTVLIYYHYSQHKHFKSYYERVVLQEMKFDFPALPSYSRFVWWIPLALLPLLWYVHFKNRQSRRTGIYYIDSTKISACDTHRAHQNKVFKGFAAWGKTSMGWFYGFKLHILINQHGELIDTRFSSGNVADNNMHLLHQITRGLEQAWIFGDKGYVCQEAKQGILEDDGRLIFCGKPRKNQKKAKQWYEHLPLLGRLWMKKRGLIESVINIHKECFDLEHTRHRSITNAFVHMYAALAAYHFRPKKPSAKIKLEPFLLENKQQKPLAQAA